MILDDLSPAVQSWLASRPMFADAGMLLWSPAADADEFPAALARRYGHFRVYLMRDRPELVQAMAMLRASPDWRPWIAPTLDDLDARGVCRCGCGYGLPEAAL